MSKEYPTTSMDVIVDTIGQQCFGMTRTAAREQGVCISCHKPVLTADGKPNPELFSTLAGVNEYDISAMCEKCFDEMFKEEGE